MNDTTLSPAAHDTDVAPPSALRAIAIAAGVSIVVLSVFALSDSFGSRELAQVTAEGQLTHCPMPDSVAAGTLPESCTRT